MIYPPEFVAACKAAYPEWPSLHAALDRGSQIVGRYLDDSAPRSVSFGEVLAATSLDALQEVVRHYERRLDLYRSWCQLLWDEAKGLGQ